MLFLEYPKCSTCRKARKWLEENDIQFHDRHIVEENPTAEELSHWYKIRGLPLKKFFNTSGKQYRALGLKDRLPEMSDEEQINLLASDGMLVKRPLLDLGDQVIIGFNEDEWAKHLLGEEEQKIIKGADSDALKKNEIINTMMNVEILHPDFYSKEQLRLYEKIPINEITQKAGTVFNTLMLFKESFASGLYKVSMPAGVSGTLMQSASGTGVMSAVVDNAGKIAGQATFIPGIDPVSITMGFVLMDLQKRFDEIKQLQKEIIDFLQEDKKAKLQGSLDFLSELQHQYRYNWKNEMFRSNQHQKVLDIKQQAMQDMNYYSGNVKKILEEKGKKLFSKDIDAKAKRLNEALQDYRMAIYIYGYSTYMEVMLQENFDKEYLESERQNLIGYSHQYRDIYSQCDALIESKAGNSIGGKILSGVSFATSKTGAAISKIPKIEKGPVDEALIFVGNAIDNAKTKRSDNITSRVRSQRESPVVPFIESIAAVDRYFNTNTELIVDNEYIYMKK